jgi:hypothetical protein
MAAVAVAAAGELDLNIEPAAPSDFIPVPDGWENRSPLIRREGKL